MKIKIMFFAFLLSLALCLPAMAEVKDFGVFTVDVPAGWNATQDKESGVVIIAAADKSAVLTIFVSPTEGVSVADIAQMFATELKGSTPQRQAGADEVYVFTYKSGEVESTAVISAADKDYLLLTMTGSNPEMGKILASIQEK